MERTAEIGALTGRDRDKTAAEQDFRWGNECSPESHYAEPGSEWALWYTKRYAELETAKKSQTND